MRARSKPVRPGREVVRSWFDTVFQPLLYGLENEHELLKRNDWTWQSQPPGLRSFAPIQNHVPPRAELVFKQFLEYHAELDPLFQKHDQGVSRLEECCRAYHEALIRSEGLCDAYKRIKQESPEKLGAPVTRFFGAYPNEHECLKALAADIINNSGDLPPHYTVAPLWNHYKRDLLEIQTKPNIRPLVEAAGEAGKKLQASVKEVIQGLKRLQLELSSKHDVPLVAPELAMR